MPGTVFGVCMQGLLQQIHCHPPLQMKKQRHREAKLPTHKHQVLVARFELGPSDLGPEVLRLRSEVLTDNARIREPLSRTIIF